MAPAGQALSLPILGSGWILSTAKSPVTADRRRIASPVSHCPSASPPHAHTAFSTYSLCRCLQVVLPEETPLQYCSEASSAASTIHPFRCSYPAFLAAHHQPELDMEKKRGAKAMDDDDAAKKPRATLRKAAVAKIERQEDEGAGPNRTLNVSLDLDALECPLCFSPFEAAIFQCKNGHAACEACCVRIAAFDGTCPCCGEPIGEIRCRPLEKAVAAVVAPCAFAARGCAQLLRLAEKRAHEALLCPHAPSACPLPGCVYSGPDLYGHIRDAHAAAGGGGEVVTFAASAPVTLHRSAPFRVLLHAVDRRVFLLLNGGDVPSGRSLSVVCLGLRPAGNRALEYTLEVGAGAGEPCALSLSASGPVPCTRRWAGHHPTEGFLFVPDAYWSSSGSVSVTVHVRKLKLDKA